MNKKAILLVDDEKHILLSYSLILRTSGFDSVRTVSDSREVMPILAEKEIAAVILDLVMPHVSGTDLLNDMRGNYPHIPVIVMTATDEVNIAVECMKRGAFDYLVKPVEKCRFVSSVKKVLEIAELRDEVSSLRDHFLSDTLKNAPSFKAYITRSKKMNDIFRYAEAVAGSAKPVYIFGETGVGKEVLAKIIYELSGVRGKFIPVNLAGLDDIMFSDTLFGHKKGAFTGADSDRMGLIRQASGGVLLLDEIGDLREPSQLKLLRLMEEQTYYPLGSDTAQSTDARIIATTNRDLSSLIKTGQFRKDLFYRLSIHSIYIPPLRERKEDIPLLLEHFLETAAKSLNRKKPSYPRELITLLSNYDFPGNVRELQAMVYDSVARHTRGIISLDNFKNYISSKGKDICSGRENVERAYPFLFEGIENLPTLSDIEKILIQEALKRSDSNQNIAASLLGISRQALNKRLTRKNQK
ncbi:MAG: sigma-54-dependent Fis family transcriptional regulator [Nitrospiraceae bacterium]|nr:MAG: sigma-54-dependent Fis family transcriptional regulator [Nitrospiraceae bacterium]